jgi:hypothetical protein
MQWDTISDQWALIVVAGVSVVLFGALAAYYFYKPKTYDETKPFKATMPHDATKPYDATKTHDAIQNHKGWIPTGRVDFLDPGSIGNFILQAEETRIVDSIGSVVHREIRWRTATLEEADGVLVAYHAQRRLVMAPNYLVTSSNEIRRDSHVRIEQHQETQLENDEASDAQPEEYTRPDDGTNYVLPKASHLINPS